ncbi:Uncharacterised protein [Serratia marcescens]|nr:Uncharacterised protein [Serratia marcescens]
MLWSCFPPCYHTPTDILDCGILDNDIMQVIFHNGDYLDKMELHGF